MTAMHPADGVRIASPCPATWERMSGDERVRHCTLCELNVYNFAEMTRAEIGALLQRTEGRVCARLYRRADGTVLTRDCPSAVQRMRASVSRWKSALMAAVLGVSGFVSGCTTTGKTPASTPPSRATGSVMLLQESVLEGVVVDGTGASLPGARIVLCEKSTGHEHELTTNADGRFAMRFASGEEFAITVVDGAAGGSVRDLRVRQEERLSTTAVPESYSVTVGVLATDDESMTPLGFGVSARFTKRLMDELPLF
jgi:hypothetical protein